ncbi:MAG TPA: MFS transporter [Caulobacterales bacterium]|nr:MFS transporter [Caulobacterales bacterium]
MSSSFRSLAALIGVVLVAMTGFGVFLPIFPFLALHLGGSPTTITIAMGAYSLGQVIAAPFWGQLSDRIGRKPVLIAGLAGGALSYLMLAHAHSVLELGGARLFGGLMAGNVGAAFAAAADLADDRTRARNMGLLGAGVGFAFIAGPAFGALLIGAAPDTASYMRVCYAAAGFAGAAALGALLFFDETLKPGAAGQTRVRRWALLASRPALARFVAVMFMMIAAQALMETTFGLWSRARLEWGPREVGIALAGLGLGAALLQGGAAGRAARALGERLTLVIGLALFSASLGGLAAAEAAPATVAALATLVLGAGLATPALQSLIAAQAGGQETGAVMGLSQSAAALGRVAGPLFAGFLFDAIGPGAPFVLGAALLLCALFVTGGELQPAPSRG